MSSFKPSSTSAFTSLKRERSIEPTDSFPPPSRPYSPFKSPATVAIVTPPPIIDDIKQVLSTLSETDLVAGLRSLSLAPASKKPKISRSDGYTNLPDLDC